MPSRDRRQVVFEHLASTAATADLYIVSLTFSVLALSVQFAVPQSFRAIAELFQALGWTFLVASGLAGIKLLANVGDRYYFEAAEAIAEGEPLPESGKAMEAAVRYAHELMHKRWKEKTESQLGWLLPIQFWGLFLGIVCLVVARISLLRIFGGVKLAHELQAAQPSPCTRTADFVIRR